ncbi:MAG: Asp-tRNA(Asn)/Glu-tRNA(Gln) amidotransferase subunit GatC [Eubacteriales bacterium]|nr:Asp-tRNA(Asn)/Glu-tRNA(Gln) amidotransferase subunit GatC [Clostridia bacterium]
MKLSKRYIEKIAYISRLDLSDKEIDHYRQWLSQAFEYFSIIKEVETEDIEPMTRATEKTNVFRTDEQVKTNKDIEGKPLLNTQHDGYFIVPGIFEDDKQ